LGPAASSHDVANKLLIWCLAIITHSAPYEILGDVYFVIAGICVENWLRLMTFWHKPTTPMMFAVVPTSSLTVFRHLHMAACPKNNNRLEQITGKHNQHQYSILPYSDHFQLVEDYVTVEVNY
jgi:hypothetical protein